MAAAAYETPDYELLNVVQTIRCGRHGVRRQADLNHAATIRRTAKRLGLHATVTLTDGAAHVRFTGGNALDRAFTRHGITR